MDYYINVGNQQFPSPFCQVGKGNTADEALSQASRTVGATAILAAGHCDQLSYHHTNQLGGFWDDYGTINYEDDNWHWYCKNGDQDRGVCDAGDGAPKRKRGVEFSA